MILFRMVLFGTYLFRLTNSFITNILVLFETKKQAVVFGLFLFYFEQKL